ncbi:MAG: HAMP domain-containing histidine kinase [Bdellovibrionales bacterium]|nr:HAMP domain-containing histidine kinase [Bdellovibrionales bacterium]
MRAYFVLIFTAILIAFGAGYYTFYLQSPTLSMTPDIEDVNRVKNAVLVRLSPVAIVDLLAIYDRPAKQRLLNLESSPLHSGYKFNKLSFLAKQKSCREQKEQYESLAPKEKVWTAFRCGWRKTLPSHFFLTPPYLSPSGFSYVFLAMQSPYSLFRERTWIYQNLSYVHIHELALIKEETEHLPSPFLYLSDLNDEALRGVIEGESLILSDSLFLTQVGFPRFGGSGHYRVYLRKDVDYLLRKTNYRVSAYAPGKECGARESMVCWGYSAKHAFQRATRSSYVIFISSLILIVIVMAVLFNRIKMQRKTDAIRSLILRVLSHELRTPIAGMLVQLEQLKKGESQLTERDEEAFLRLSADVYRLQRLTENSRKYLTIEKSQGMFRVEPEQIPSMRDYMLGLADPYDSAIHLEEPEEDFSVRFDVYWLGICIKNLLENALSHGQGEVKLSWFRVGRQLNIYVEDQGHLETADIDKLTQAFFKGGQSKGSGLGLYLVKTIIEELGGQMKIHKNPTRFTLSLKDVVI